MLTWVENNGTEIPESVHIYDEENSYLCSWFHEDLYYKYDFKTKTIIRYDLEDAFIDSELRYALPEPVIMTLSRDNTVLIKRAYSTTKRFPILNQTTIDSPGSFFRDYRKDSPCTLPTL